MVTRALVHTLTARDARVVEKWRSVLQPRFRCTGELMSKSKRW